MLRIHFTMDDLASVRLVKGPELAWEVLLSLHKLRDSDGTFVFGDWRRRILQRLPNEASWLLGLAPPRGYSPDFLTPAAGGDLDRVLAEILATPKARLSSELAFLGTERSLDSMGQSLATGNLESLKQLGTAIRRYFHIGLSPFWAQINAAVHADLTVRAGILASEGIGTVLAGLHPQTAWRSPVLEVPFPEDRDFHLAGRGLLLVPSFFCWGRPITFKNPELPPVFVYPIEHDLGWSRQHRDTARPVPIQARPPAGPAALTSARPLAALIGRTRLSVLTTIADGGCTTTQLAQRAGVSIASASQHAAVLRDAGLITTTRRGGCVIHAATPAAHALVTGPADPDRPRELAR